MTNAAILRRLLGEGLTNEDVRRYDRIKEECYRESARGTIRLMPGVQELLDTLVAQGFRLAIGSSAPRENLDLTIEDCGLENTFSTIVSVGDIRRGKPDPEVFALGAQRLGERPADCVVFEDAVVGIQAARAAGMYAVGVGTTNPLEALLAAGADEAVADLVGYDVAGLTDRMTR
jgi:HAD superfamily hydrolase (TIGR01509 family)